MADPASLVWTSKPANEKGTQCPDFDADLTRKALPNEKKLKVPAEFDLQLWDLLLSKSRAIESLKATLHKARHQLCYPSLFEHEITFFTTAEAEAREKV